MKATRYVIVLVCVVSVSVVCAQSSPAERVPFDQWAYEAVQKLVDDAPFGTVYPSRVTPSGRPFPDVPVDHWAFDAVEKLRKAGIIVGYPSGTFN